MKALVVANEAVVGKELRDALGKHLDDRVKEIFVVSPALQDSGVKYMLGDVDEAIAPAKERLEATLRELREAGYEATGEVGDSDPMMATRDEILKHRPDQILVVAHTDEEGAFAEKGLIEQLERDLDQVVTEVVVDRAERPHVVDVKETESVAGRDKGWRPSANMPPLSGRDMAGIAIAIVGTRVLGGLAAECAGDSGDGVEGKCAAVILIATGMALINLAHVVGLFLFQSVGYEGFWNRLLARLSLFGTPLALVVALALNQAM